MQLRKTWAALLAIVCASAHALGDTPQEEAKRLQNRGVDLHQAGKFEEALVHYRASYAIQHNPNVWVNIIWCLVDIGEPIKAIAEFDEHTKTDWVGLSEQSREDLVTYLRDIGKVLGFGLVSIEVAQPGVVFADGLPQGNVPKRVMLRMLAGSHVVRVEVPDMAPVTRDVVVKPGEIANLTFPLHRFRSIDFSAAFVAGATLGTNLEQRYDDQATNPQQLALGFNVGARVLLSPHKQLSLRLGIGYLQIQTRLAEQMTWQIEGPDGSTVFRMQHALAFYGAHLDAGVQARIDIPRGKLDIGLGLGGVIGGYQETGVGSVTWHGEDAENASIVKGSRFLLAPVVTPDVRVSQRWKLGEFGLSLGMLVFPFGSLSIENPVAAPDAPCDDQQRSCAAAAERLSSLIAPTDQSVILFRDRRMMPSIFFTAGAFIRWRW